MLVVSTNGKLLFPKTYHISLKILKKQVILEVDGNTFRIKLSDREFGHGDIITYDKYNGAELYITDEDILPVGDGFIYTVQMVNNNTNASI